MPKIGTKSPIIGSQTVNRQRESAENRRHAVVAAARAIIVEKGLEGLRTRDVADRVGINIATLHYHVSSKEALVELVAHSIGNEFKERARSRVSQNATATEQLRQKLDSYLEVFQGQSELSVVFYELMERSRRDAAIFEILSSMRTKWVQSVTEVLELGIEDGSFRANMDPLSGAALFVSTLIGIPKLPKNLQIQARDVCAELERSFQRVI